MSQGTYRIRTGWPAIQQLGVFRIGTSGLDGPDGLGYEFSDPEFIGEYDDLTPFATEVVITRGDTDPTAKVCIGKMDVTLFDKAQLFNVKNDTSPLTGLIKPLRPGRAEIEVDGTWYDLFNGFVLETSSDPEIGVKESKIHYQDMTIWLERAENIVIADTGPTTVGAVINLILDEIEWDPLDRDIDTGSLIPGFSADGSQNGIKLIEGLLEAERGTFFASRAGTPTYADRNTKDAKTSSFTFAAVDAAQPGMSLRNIKNRASVTKEGGVTQVAYDEASKDEYGFGDWPAITTPYLNSDAEALSLAQYLVYKGKDPVARAWGADFLEGEAGYLAAIAQREILDRITLSAQYSEGDYFIHKMTHRGSAGKFHKLEAELEEAGVNQTFLIGSGQIGGPQVLGF